MTFKELIKFVDDARHLELIDDTLVIITDPVEVELQFPSFLDKGKKHYRIDGMSFAAPRIVKDKKDGIH